MKARIKSNGHIVNVSQKTEETVISKNGIERIYENNDCRGVFYAQSELEFIKESLVKDIDWEQRRYEIAKAVMIGNLAAPVVEGIDPNPSIQHLVNHSIMLADALIAELKKGVER